MLRRWLAGRTLRGRLIAGLLSLLAVACACVGIVSYFAVRGFLFAQLDQQLAGAAMRYTSCVTHKGGPPDGMTPKPGMPPPPLRNCAVIPGQAVGTFSARLYNYQVRTVNVAAGHCDLSVPDAKLLLAVPQDGKPHDLDLPSAHGEYRLTAIRADDHQDGPQDDPQDGPQVLVTGLPLAGLQDTLHQVELVELVIFSVALLLTGIIGAGWVRLSLRPLRRVTAVAGEVTQLPLGSGEVALPHRVPASDPRTEVGQLGVAFNRMLGHVESALARRHASEARLRSFAADASHELRTPLAAIRGYAELARRHRGAVPDEVAHALARVESESERMSVLVDDLLLLARLDAGRPLASDPVDLTRLAIDAASDAQAAAPGHRWLLQLPDEPVVVRGDEARLRQVLANLASNAGRHTPPGSTVTIALGETTAPPPEPGQEAAQVPGAAVLSVSDDGPGIPEALQPVVFERFVRGDSSRSRTAGSTGLGLSIVAAVVAAHQGRVEVASQPGRTTFAILLPLTSS
jgi:two-component system, OmpR family, sensor kinase